MLYKYLETHILNLILTSKYYSTAEEVAVNGGRVSLKTSTAVLAR